MGSVADKVVHNAHIPVILIHPSLNEPNLHRLQLNAQPTDFRNRKSRESLSVFVLNNILFVA